MLLPVKEEKIQMGNDNDDEEVFDADLDPEDRFEAMNENLIKKEEGGGGEEEKDVHNDHLYEIRKHPVRDQDAAASLRIVLQQKRRGHEISAAAKKTKQKVRVIRKKTIDPRIATLRNGNRTLEKTVLVLHNIQQETAIFTAPNDEGNSTATRCNSAFSRQLGSMVKVVAQISPIIKKYAEEQEVISQELITLERECQEHQEKFNNLTESVLAWGKNVLRWRPPDPYEFERFPVTLFQLRVHSVMDDPAAKFSSDKKKKAKAKANKRKFSALKAPTSLTASASASALSTVGNRLTQIVETIPTTVAVKKQRT